MVEQYTRFRTRRNTGAGPGRCAQRNGNYAQTAAGALNLQLGGTRPGTQFDQLIVTGAASLDGALQVSLINGFRPAPGDAFAVLTCGLRAGQFTGTGGLVLGGVSLSPAYATTSVTLDAVADVQPLLDSIGMLANGQFQFRLLGAPDQNFAIQASSNLVDWITLLTTNTASGLVEFVDSEAGLFGQRFYRALTE